MPTPHPLINGNRYQHSDAKITIGTRVFIDIKSIQYKESLKPGIVRGTKVRVQGRTQGVYEADGSLEMYAGEAQELKRELAKSGRGWGATEFTIVINYEAPGMDMVTVELIGCRITDNDTTHSDDENAVFHKFELSIMRIRENGIDMVVDN